MSKAGLAPATKRIPAPKRIPIPKRVRFEVFKRDKFTCQYCGRSAPEVVLQCDHVQAVAGGGGNEVMNLITSCIDCNNGKGSVPLSDVTAVSKQRRMLEVLEEKRQQIEMMLQWRDELQKLDVDTVSAIERTITQRSGWALSDVGKAKVRKWLKRFSVSEVLSGLDEAFDAYLEHGPNGKGTTSESFNKAFNKVPAFIDIMKQQKDKPYLKRLFYIQGILRNRAGLGRGFNCVQYLEHLHLCGQPLEAMERNAKIADSLPEFMDAYDGWLKQIGKPW
jgi:hypothetical protein